MFAAYEFEDENGTLTTETTAGTISFAIVNQALLYLYVYGAEDELDWTRQAAKGWVRMILAANQ